MDGERKERSAENEERAKSKVKERGGKKREGMRKRGRKVRTKREEECGK